MKTPAIFAVIGFIVFAVGAWFLYSGAAPALTTDQEEQAATANPRKLNLAERRRNLNAAAAESAPITTDSNQRYMQATLSTNYGDITIEFFTDAAPNTVANFTKLANEGFYDGVKFHRVIEGFMIQGGDPLTKDDAMQARWGTGGPGYTFADEIHADNRNMAGTISMANAGPNTNGSQFFINTKDNNFLDTKHTVFGKVIAGMDVVTKIEQVETGPMDRPVEPVVIQGIALK